MPIFKLRPWEGEAEVEVCGVASCFELKDKGHRVYVFFKELSDKRSITMTVDLQKEEGYKEYVRRVLEFDLPWAGLEELPQFYAVYKAAVELINSRRAEVEAEWEDGEVRTAVVLKLEEESLEVVLRAECGPHSFYYEMKVAEEKGAFEVKALAEGLARLYLLFKEYVKGRAVQEKT